MEFNLPGFRHLKPTLSVAARNFRAGAHRNGRGFLDRGLKLGSCQPRTNPSNDYNPQQNQK